MREHTIYKVELAEGLVVGPKDRLIIRLDHEYEDEKVLQELQQALDDLGILKRTLVIFGDGIELTKIEGE